MSDHKFDRLLSEIRSEHVDDQVVSQAGERVWSSIARTPAAELSMHKLRNCEDFQTLIPAYLNRNLPEARGLLFEDHVHQCVACRHAVEQARSGELHAATHTAANSARRPERQTARRPALTISLQAQAESRIFPAWRWAMSAAAAAVVAVAALALANGIFPGQHAVRGAVQNVDGSLYTVADDQVRLIPAGYQIRNGDEIRTAKGSNAVVRLVDGSLVEMGERSDLSVSREWKGTTIHLDGGRIMVQAAKQRTGRLYVATDDCLVSVKGTIFSVNHGTKGSRVAVIEGVVRVAYGDRNAELRAGDEATSTSSVSKVPIQNEIAWSRDAAKYLALLGDFSILQKQFEAIPGPGLRYSSDLLAYVPDNTVVYAAIPNLAPTLSEASQLFQDRMQQSPALRSWWKEQQRGKGPKLADVIGQLKTLSSYLGDEIVFTVAKEGSTYSAPVVLAKVEQPGLESFLQGEAKHLNAGGAQAALQIVHDPSAVTASANRPFLVYVNNGMLVASPDVVELQHAAARIQQSGASHFSETPLYQQVAHSYQQGAGWLFCADMEQIVAQHVQDGSNQQLPPGIGDVRYLMMERREVGSKTENRAALTFASERRGVASWLAAPASMGALEFISPNASMVNAVVIKNPRSIMEELFQIIGSSDTKFPQELANFEAKTGVSVLDDITAPLGGEVAFAFDGPVLPTPKWKAVFEVYDPATLQATIAKLVDSLNQEAAQPGRSLQLSQQQVGSQTYYTIRSAQQTNFELDYTYVDTYLIAGPDIATLSQAIRDRQAGNTLTHSQTFQALLPSDGYTNFSAIFYHNIGPVMGPLVDQIKSVGKLTQQQQQSITALQANATPGLIYAYGEHDRIVVASETGFMGFDLGTLMTLGQGGPFAPQMFLRGALSQPLPSNSPTQ
ncbi:MAG TPA: FecR domain-containing protein [Candidatus Sulfotelmatobacter sp.]|nr:FecR domain-containing protein [Candidatus Sulfotelmatobacter sp.]